MRERRQRGLTLVEMVAVAGLISLILLLTLGLIPYFKLSNRRANMELQAGNLAQSALEQARAAPFDSLASSPASSVPLEGVDYQLRLDVTDGAVEHSKRVRAVVSWQWKERSYQVFRETLLTRLPRS